MVFRTRQKSCGEQFFFEEPMFWSLKYFFLFSMTSKLKQKLCPQDFPKRVREHRAVLTRFAKEVFLQKQICKLESLFSGLKKMLLLFQQNELIYLIIHDIRFDDVTQTPEFIWPGTNFTSTHRSSSFWQKQCSDLKISDTMTTVVELWYS